MNTTKYSPIAPWQRIISIDVLMGFAVLGILIIGFLVGYFLVITGMIKNFSAGWTMECSMFGGKLFNYWGSIFVSFGYIGLVMLFCKSNLFSYYWLKYFRFGPLEWLWRSLSYMKFQPIKLDRNKLNQVIG